MPQMEIPTKYDPSLIETKWYTYWMSKGFFRSIPDNREPYTIVIPPPNVTGVLHMPNALEKAQALYVDCNIFKEENKHIQERLEQLPASCYESAERLEKKREVFENNGIFPKGMLNNTIRILKSHKDQGLSEKLYGKTDEIKELVEKYLHIA